MFIRMVCVLHEDGAMFIRIVCAFMRMVQCLLGWYDIYEAVTALIRIALFIRMRQCLLGWYAFVRMIQDLMEMQPDGQSLASSGNISTSTDTITDCNISLQFKMVSVCSEKPTCASPCLSAVCH